MSQITKDKILEAIEAYPESKKALMVLFPECFEQVNLSTLHISTNEMIDIRAEREYRGVAFYLNDEEFNWEYKRDSGGYLCLIPTKKWC